jgi:hypothetical protein
MGETVNEIELVKRQRDEKQDFVDALRAMLDLVEDSPGYVPAADILHRIIASADEPGSTDDIADGGRITDARLIEEARELLK